MKNENELREALAAAGIQTGADLAEAIKAEQPVQIFLMTAPAAGQKTA